VKGKQKGNLGMFNESILIQWIREGRAMTGIAQGLVGFLLAIRLVTWDRSEHTNRSKYLILLLIGLGLSGVIEGIALIVGQSINGESLGVVSQITILVSNGIALISLMIYTLYLFGIVNGVAPYSSQALEEKIYDFLVKEVDRKVNQVVDTRLDALKKEVTPHDEQIRPL
jgi:hypothetical protein